MEHGALASCLEGSRENLAHTYLTLAASTPGSQRVHDSDFEARVGAIDHPIGNVGLRLNLSIRSAARLAALAADHPSLTVYRMPGDQPVDAGCLLESAGFRQIHELALMASQADACSEDGIAEANGPERIEAAQFMAKQFFAARPLGFRRRIAEATAASTPLRLFVRREGGKVVAGAMASEHGGMLGIYNVCVAKPHRLRGLGSRMVRFALGLAQRNELAATLQCDPALCAWYRRLGFEELGRVHVYGLLGCRQVDIMDARSREGDP